MNPPSVSVVVPVYNNARTLPELSRRIHQALRDHRVEIVMVDDASADESLSIMNGLDVVAIAAQRNLGQNGAILAGLGRAVAPVCCVLDADLEDPPEALPVLVERLAVGDVDVVFSSRQAPSRLTSRLFRFAIHGLFPTLPPHPCLCFAVGSRARQALVETATEDDYLPAVIGALGVRTTQIDVVRERRGDDASAYAGSKRVRYASAALWSALKLRARVALKRR